ncbi:MAG: hypothetical protein AAFW68_06675, partial [Pseudomonadota bacterium]
MPKMKKTAAKKKSARKSASRKSSRKKQTGFFDRVSAVWTRFSHAMIASSVLIAFVAIGFLWAGGYVGLMGEKLNRAAGSGAVNAGFEITRITSRGLSQTSEDDVLSAVGPVIGSSILHFDAHRARAQVEQLGVWAPLGIFLLRFTSVVIPALPGTAYSVLSGSLF